MASLAYSTAGDQLSIEYFQQAFSGASKKQEPPAQHKMFDANSAFDALHYKYVTEYVKRMYGGRGAQHDHVIMNPETTFEDPAAICKGYPEIQEAFQALTYLQPQSLAPPTCVNVQPLGDSILLTYSLKQRYLGRLELRSLLMVQVQLQQRQDIPESDFLVLRMEEHWNGIPPLSSYLFWAVRRINGIVSYQLTSKLLSS